MTPRTARTRFRGGQVAALVWVVAVSLAVGWVIAHDAAQERRFREQIVAEQQRQAQDIARRTRAQCSKWRQEAAGSVNELTTDLGRVIVRTAAAAYELSACPTLTGPLPRVDPDAYVPQPVPPRPPG